MLRFLLGLLLGRRLPTVEGDLVLPGPSRACIIRRDSYGIPHIEADNDHDAAFALGFVQAQDRTGQLEVIHRLIRGTLAALVGPPGLPADRLTRRIGFRRAALQQLPTLHNDIQQFLQAFTHGINAGHEYGLKHWPHEFAIFRSRPSAWDGADVLAYVKFMSFQLPSNWDVELARFIMLRTDGPAAVRALDPVGALAADASSPSSLQGDPQGGLPRGMARLLEDLAVLEALVPPGGGSNNWVLAGSRTATGQPLMASDPHLGPNLPNPWYLAHVTTPAWSVAGALFAGTPVFPIAHNGHCCWSVTAGLTDTTDLFVETLSEDGRRCRQPDGSWTDCQLVDERIEVKGGQAVTEQVLLTPRGPLVTPLIPGETQAISLQAVWLQPRPLRGFFDAVRARSFAEFRKPFEYWPVLPLNVLYADRQGTIGYQLIGELPVRVGGHGLLPVRADGGAWQGYVPFDALPRMENPPSGFLATANDDPHDWCPGQSDPTPHLGSDFIDDYRARIIRQELARKTNWSAEDCRLLQLNVRSLPWEELRDTVLALTPASADAPSADARLALDQLRAWDGQISIDSPAAAIFELFLAEISTRAAKAKAPRSWALALGGDGQGPFAHSLLGERRTRHISRLIRAQPPGWFTGGWTEELLAALAAAVQRLRAAAGPSPPYWAWGHRRMLRLRHPILGKHWLFSRIFSLGPVPIAGDANTISQAAVRPLTPLEETHNFANLRCVFDTADWSNCRFVLAGGQSGNPCSQHFDDQFPLWQRGEAIPIAWTSAEVLAAARHSLRLSPTEPTP